MFCPKCQMWIPPGFTRHRCPDCNSPIPVNTPPVNPHKPEPAREPIPA